MTFLQIKEIKLVRKYKLPPVTPPMPLEALYPTISEQTGGNFIFFYRKKYVS